MEVSFVSLLSCNQLALWDEVEDTPPTLGHQLRVKWDEQWGGGHPTPPHPFLVIKSWELSKVSLSTSCIKNIILQCWYTETPGVWLVLILFISISDQIFFSKTEIFFSGRQAFTSSQTWIPQVWGILQTWGSHVWEMVKSCLPLKYISVFEKKIQF